jgi:hypothetical protein
MTTDYRALCAELVLQMAVMDDSRHWDDSLYDYARAALSQPEPVAPTDEELLAMRSWSCHGPTFDSDLVDFGRRCYNLGRYGTPTIEGTNA